MERGRAMRVARDAGGLADFRGGVFVPTMGALHEGHAALIRAARERAGPAGRVVVSVFVNPTQFNDPADYERYPRTLDADAALCEEAGAGCLFAPERDAVYPPGAPATAPALPPVATEPGLEDRFRPGHFAGVCLVVRRLFDLVRPSVAVFGEKDWQQAAVVKAMAARDTPEIEIATWPTVRESDGLAMSSRNRFLTPRDRRAALSLSAALRAAGAERSPADAEAAMRRVLAGAGVRVEYAAVRRAESLLPFAAPASPRAAGDPPGRALIAGVVGAVRLIDNAAWPGGHG